jgi:signal peptidase I
MPIFFVLLVLIVCLILSIRYTFVVVTIVNNSMSPTLNEGDRVLAFRCWPYFFLKKGQIVLILPPDSYRQPGLDAFSIIPFIKRVVGLPGDTVALPIQSSVGVLKNYEQRSLEIPRKHFFARGDNNESSLDSTTWGALPFSSLLGIIVMRLPYRKDN